MNILLIGIDYFSNRGSGDKNFWFQLLPVIANDNLKIVVLSFNYRRIKNEKQKSNIEIINVKPFHLGIDIIKDISNVENKEKCHIHFRKQPRSFIERSLSLLLNINKIKKLVKRYNINNIHFMDNFGPLMGLLSYFVSPIKISITSIGFLARSRFHEKYLSFSLNKINSIVPTTDAYREKLIDCNIDAGSLRTIHWGIDVSQFEINKTIIHQNKIVLWTGFIQQVREESFFISLDIAQNILCKCSDISFIFAFKPECFNKKYLKYNSENIDIKVTNQNEFSNLIKDVDILLSPVTNNKTIVSPPLTWIECMALEIPIFTTHVGGVDEIITHRVNGYIANSNHELISGILESFNFKDYIKMGKKARLFVTKNYNINRIAQQYIELWRSNEQ